MASGTSTLSSTSSLVTEARSESLPCITGALKPGVPFSTRNPLTLPSSFLAQTTATSASDPFVIHIFEPFRTQPESVFFARVRMPAGLDPASGSVSPKQPISSPAAIPGSQRSFCSSDPEFQIANIASDPCTEQNDRSPESPASSSRHVSPYAVADAPAHP